MPGRNKQETSDLLFIYGRQPVWEALRSGIRIQRLILAKGTTGSLLNRVRNAALRNNVPIIEVGKNDLQKFVGAVVHQGVAAEVSASFYLNREEFYRIVQTKADPLLLILDQIQDPHNLGAIVRTAEIAGVDAIVLPEKGSAAINATVVKTSAGAVFNMRFFRTPSLTEEMGAISEQGVRIAALVPGSDQTIFHSDLTGSLALLVGNEGQGVRKNLLPLCAFKMTIPQFGKVNSLNASVSTAVALFEAVRQRRFRN